MLNKASSLNRLLLESGSPSRCESSLELEALAAVHQLSADVQSISVSEMLPVIHKFVNNLNQRFLADIRAHFHQCHDA